MNDEHDDPIGDEKLSQLIRQQATRHRASEQLHAAVRTQIALQSAATTPARPAPTRKLSWPRFQWPSVLTGFLSGAAVAAAAVLLVPRLLVQESLPGELVADHVRALKIGPLYTVASSDRHTVKPWFQGRLDYAPQVIDLAAQGFTLLGGRVEQVAGAPTAALSYEHGHHVIHAFVWPADKKQLTPSASQIKGFNLLHWSDASMQVWLVSDIEAGELERFRQAWISQLH